MTRVPYRLLLGDAPTGAVVTSRRTAVKALVRRGPDVLMLYAPALQVYKCPGGGVEPGETAAETLARELAEETGLTLVRIGATVAEVIERRRDTRDHDGVFVMTSSYVECWAIHFGGVATTGDVCAAQPAQHLVAGVRLLRSDGYPKSSVRWRTEVSNGNSIPTKSSTVSSLHGSRLVPLPQPTEVHHPLHRGQPATPTSWSSGKATVRRALRAEMPRTIAGLLIAQADSDRPAVLDGDRSLSYRDLAANSHRLVARAFGV